MKKILFGITSLTLGGAERVLVDIANKLCEDYEITIFTIYAKGELEKQLSKKVIIKNLCDKSYLELSKVQKHLVMPLKILLCKRMIYKKRIESNYNVEIAFLEGPITRLFSVKNLNTKKIAWIHTDMFRVFGQGLKAKIKKQIDKKIYQKYEKLVFVSKDNLEQFKQLYPSLKKEQLVIYNYIDKEKVIEKSKQNIDDKFDFQNINLVTVARLVEEKAIERLLNIHKKLIDEGLQHCIYVIGDGPLRTSLEEKIKKEEVKETFHLLGKRENPYPYIKMADYFCLLSYYEGYGMVLEEAKILEKQIVITNTAAREAVDNYENSTILENNQKDIYEGLKKIILKGKSETKKLQKEYQNENIIKEIKQVIGEEK